MSGVNLRVCTVVRRVAASEVDAAVAADVQAHLPAMFVF
jgi:hypothetical protein